MFARIVLLLILFPIATSIQGQETIPFQGNPSKWMEFDRYDVKFGDLEGIVIVPSKSLPGKPWVWRGEFFGAFPNADVELVKQGWHLVYLNVPNLFGAPKAMKSWEEFHSILVSKHGLHPKAALLGMSRGGLYCMNWGALHPDKTLAIYLDNAVCDFKSWPGGAPKKLGTGKGSEAEWVNLLKAYEFKNDQEAIDFRFNPVDQLQAIATAKVPVLLIYGDSDTVVPGKENSDIVFERLTELDGVVERIVKPGQDHHPHGLDDPAPIIRFFQKAWKDRSTHP